MATSPQLVSLEPLRRVVSVALVALAVLGAHHAFLRSSHGGEGAEAVTSSAVRWRLVPAARGEILDRDGSALASNRLAFNIYAIPGLFTPEVRARLIDVLDLGDEEVAELDSRAARLGGDQAGRAIMLLEDQTRRRAALIAEAGPELGGAVEVQADSHRVYPHGRLAAHLIGYVSRSASNQPANAEDSGYDNGEPVGRYGIEKALERSLSGGPGIERFIIDATGNRVADEEAEALIEEPRYQSPVAGHDVHLTIDLELQRIVERSVKRHVAAAAVVVEVETGRILAMVSTPSFDPNRMSSNRAAAERERLAADPGRPDADRALQLHYPPASTFKLVTAVAGLENGLASPGEELTCTGQRTEGKRVMRDMGTHGTIDFIQALQRSCNVYFWTIGERVGIDRLARTARDFGLGARTGLGINDEVPGQIPDSTWHRSNAGLVPTLDAAIGGGDVRVTVLQLAMAYAAVANGGRLYAPQIVARMEAMDGKVEERQPVLRRRLTVWPATLDIVRQGMWRAVNTEGGTAVAGRRGAVQMAGKTGTAPAGRDEASAGTPHDRTATHAWFAGWAPWDRPEIVVVVLIEKGGVGGKVAAPVARAIVDGYFGVQSPPRRRRR